MKEQGALFLRTFSLRAAQTRKERNKGLARRTYRIALPSISICQRFVGVSTAFSDADFTIVSGRYEVNAKSLMSIFALDITRPLTLAVVAPEERFDDIDNGLAPFRIAEAAS